MTTSGAYAVCLIERADREEYAGLRAMHYQNYLDGIRETLIDVYGEAIAYGGAWTSGKRYTRVEKAS